MCADPEQPLAAASGEPFCPILYCTCPVLAACQSPWLQHGQLTSWRACCCGASPRSETRVCMCWLRSHRSGLQGYTQAAADGGSPTCFGPIGHPTARQCEQSTYQLQLQGCTCNCPAATPWLVNNRSHMYMCVFCVPACRWCRLGAGRGCGGGVHTRAICAVHRCVTAVQPCAHAYKGMDVQCKQPEMTFRGFSVLVGAEDCETACV